ncbi:MAG: hypothetical protein NTW86_15410 [Candidatus Sumerlaeota bacterium]|nr:hypothetical protein [Candidatus Sumerlaeota bacterium]
MDGNSLPTWPHGTEFVHLDACLQRVPAENCDAGAEPLDFIEVMSCDQNGLAAVRVCELGDDAAEILGSDRVKAPRRFIQEQERGISQKGANQGKTLLVSRRILLKPSVAEFAEVEDIKQMSDSESRLILGHPIQAREEHQVLQAGEPPVEAAFVRRDQPNPLPHAPVVGVRIEPEDANHPACRLDKAGDRLDQRGLSLAIPSDEAEDLSFVNGQSHVAQSRDFGWFAQFQEPPQPREGSEKSLRQVFDFDNWTGHSVHLRNPDGQGFAERGIGRPARLNRGSQPLGFPHSLERPARSEKAPVNPRMPSLDQPEGSNEAMQKSQGGRHWNGDPIHELRNHQDTNVPAQIAQPNEGAPVPPERALCPSKELPPLAEAWKAMINPKQAALDQASGITHQRAAPNPLDDALGNRRV